MKKYYQANRFTFFDVETPNSSNNSICSIGIIHLKENEIVFSNEYLINPEAKFDNTNMEIHGITPRMVEHAPVFSQLWEEIKEYFTNAVVVAHNAAFDLNVLSKTLLTYDIAVPEFNYICTLEKARRHIPKEKYGSHKLNVLSEAFQINLGNHHNAMCDTLACKELFRIFTEKFGIDDNDVRTYVIKIENPGTTKKSIVQKAINTIYGIIFGIGCDRKIIASEYQAIYEWMEENKEFKSNLEFKECYDLLQEVLADEYITYAEYNSLMECFQVYKSSSLFSDSTLSMQVLKGIVKGIEADREVNTEEAQELLKWMNENATLKGNYPFDKIFDTLEHVLENNMIDQEEEKILLEMFYQFTNPEEVSYSEIDLKGRVCCLTGNFSNGTKSDVEKFIVCRGGSCTDGLNKTVDYLIVGGQGSDAWKYGNYGSKVGKAVQMQEKGSSIQIVGEKILYNRN